MQTTRQKQREITLTREQFARLKQLGYRPIPATLAQTMGPNWRHIFFVSKDGSKRDRGQVHYYDVDMSPEALYEIAKS